ncbi:MAG: hypothetical protein ABSG49_00630 [Methanoregula sp.]|jgi:hypothetical protein|uniref:hypothetical protein n=1 Tax=Methanoregula sp. TaxID=2052170 RepID=UPI003C244CA3
MENTGIRSQPAFYPQTKGMKGLTLDRKASHEMNSASFRQQVDYNMRTEFTTDFNGFQLTDPEIRGDEVLQFGF